MQIVLHLKWNHKKVYWGFDVPILFLCRSFAGLRVLGPPTNLCLSAFATVSPRVALFSLASHVWGATVSFSSPFLPLQWWRRPEPCMGPGRVFFLKAFSPHTSSDLRTRWRGKRHQPVLAFPIRTGQKQAEILYDRGWLIFMYQFLYKFVSWLF